MMIGVFSDAHGNEEGFFQCLNFLKKYADKIFYLGDAVGYFPLSNKILDALRLEDIKCLKGNHDAMLLGELTYDPQRENIYQLKNGRNVISSENHSFLKGLESQFKLNIEGKNILFVHGSPEDPLNGYIYPDTDISGFEKLIYDIMFMGHTHRNFVKKIDSMLIVNVGSCGLPRDEGNIMTVALYDTINNEVSIKKIELNTDAVIEKYDGQIHESVKKVLNRNKKNT